MCINPTASSHPLWEDSSLLCLDFHNGPPKGRTVFALVFLSGTSALCLPISSPPSSDSEQSQFALYPLITFLSRQACISSQAYLYLRNKHRSWRRVSV